MTQKEYTERRKIQHLTRENKCKKEILLRQGAPRESEFAIPQIFHERKLF